MYARFKVYPSCSRMTSAYGGINTPFKYFLFFLCMPVGSGSPLKNISNLLTFLAVSCCTCKPILQSCMCLKHKDKQRSTRHSIFLLFPIDILFKSLLIHSVMLVWLMFTLKILFQFLRHLGHPQDTLPSFEMLLISPRELLLLHVCMTQFLLSCCRKLSG